MFADIVACSACVFALALAVGWVIGWIAAPRCPNVRCRSRQIVEAVRYSDHVVWSCQVCRVKFSRPPTYP